MPLLGHRVEKTIQRVDHDKLRVALLHGLAHDLRELAWRHLGGIDRLEIDQAFFYKGLDRHAETGGAIADAPRGFVEGKERRMLAALRGSEQIADGDRGFSRSSRTGQQDARPSPDAAAEHIVELG